MTKKTTPTVRQEPPELLISRTEAESKLQERVNVGNEYSQKPVSRNEEFEQLKSDVERWNNYNKELLIRIFSNDSIEKEYSRAFGGSFHMNQNWTYWLEKEREEIGDKVNRLRAIIEKLELIPSRATNIVSNNSHAKSVSPENRKIFIVHGHDEEVKQTVARALEKLDLDPIILHEQANNGQTIIEKFEKNSDVGFAIVLLTPDDVGSSKIDTSNQQPRARQNVILELGYFLGKLGRQRVCALYKHGVELPSDLSGVLYIPYDGTDSWKFSIAKEINSAGIDLDLNKLLR